MKKTLFTCFTFLFLQSVNSQKLSYGALMGFNAYDIEIDGPLNAGAGYSGLNIGGYVEYQINNRIGIKSNLIYTSVKEDNYYVIDHGVSYGNLIDKAEMNTLQIHALLKCDVRHSYTKGFYFIGGLRMTNVLNASGDGATLSGFYKSSNFGAMLGFGVNFAKHFGIELLPECNLTNTLDSSSNTAKNYGGYLNFTVNIESLIHKK